MARCHKTRPCSVSLGMTECEPARCTTHDVVVVGGGVAGLAAAQLCRRRGRSVLVLDPHPGGRARSDTKDGFVFNRGPHAVYLGGATERVLRQLGVTFAGGPPQFADGVIVVGGRSYPMPFAPASLLRCAYLGVRDKASLGSFFAKAPKLRPTDWSGRSVTDLVADLRERAKLVALMAIRTSTYCALPDALSAEVAITALQAPGVRYIDGGWQYMVDQLRGGLEIVNASVTAIGDSEVVSSLGTHRAKGMILAVGTPEAAAAILGIPAFAVDGPIEAACLDLGLTTAPDHALAMALDDPLYFSVHSPAASLAPPGQFVAHAAAYITPSSARDPAAQREQLEAHACRVGVQSDTIATSRYLHRMTVVSALPSAASGGLAGRPPIDAAGLRDVFIAGDWVGPEGQLADASFASAEASAARLCAG